nr:hypothetical protein Iba_scaffold7103CG0550 [Ipomoea batatas]
MIEADIRFAGSTEYSARAFLIALVNACRFSNFLMESAFLGSKVGGQAETIRADSSLLGSACSSSSVTNGINGCSIFNTFSKTYKSTACAM